jgi:glycerophosphoryl diester phosphodiesterase
VTLVIAHRGASADRPENTLEAFETARQAGADWVELDVRRTADDVLVVHHDAHLTDGSIIVESQAEDLPDHVPTLADALDVCDGMGVNIEIKNLPGDPDYDAEHQISAAVTGLALAYRDYDQLLITSFTMDTVDRIGHIDSAVPRGLVLSDPTGVWQAIDWAVASGHHAFNPYLPLVDAALVERVHDSGLELNVWTVNDPDQISRMVELGVDGIITDKPELARGIVDAR